MGLGRESAYVGDGADRKLAFRNQLLRAFDPTVGQIPVRCRPGRRLEGSSEMEGAEAGLVRQRLDGQVIAQMGVDELRNPLQGSSGQDRHAGALLHAGSGAAGIRNHGIRQGNSDLRIPDRGAHSPGSAAARSARAYSPLRAAP